MNAVEVQNLGYAYADRKALVDLSFSIASGEIFSLLGPNGGGKTTLFRILSTLAPPHQGRACVFDADVATQEILVRRLIGVVFQNPSLDKKLTVQENLTHQGHLYGLSGSKLKNQIADLLQKFSLADRAGDLVETLSGGLQRRAEIAKGLLHKPKLMIMDEPSTGLDPSVRLDMWAYLSELKKEGMTILLATHLMEEAEKSDRVAILHEGRLVALGTPAELKRKIGGDVIIMQTSQPQLLLKEMEHKFRCLPTALNGTVRIETRDGHKMIPQIVEAFPGLVEAVTVGKPTLEDVFIHETGERL